MGAEVDSAVELRAVQAELELRDSFIEHLRNELIAAKADTAAAEAALKAALTERDALRRELDENPRWREHSEALQEHILALRSRASLRAADRSYAVISRVPGLAPLAGRVLRSLFGG